MSHHGRAFRHHTEPDLCMHESASISACMHEARALLISRLMAACVFAGREVRENMFEKVVDLLHDLDEGMLPVSVLCPSLPIPAHAKRDRWGYSPVCTACLLNYLPS